MTAPGSTHHGDSPVHYRIVNKLLSDEGASTGYATHVLDNAELHLASVEELSSFVEAERDVAWRATMLGDMKSFEKSETWTLVSCCVDTAQSGSNECSSLRKTKPGL